ncbi:MAG: FHA domain-containing protein [Verrucomicrobia bacterium]|nr:FHA domain-containing protein [Verrucomicrobiota bacterium]
METQISILSGLSPRSEVLHSEDILVGRAADTDLILNHPEVSRRHCRIQKEGETWCIEDLGSRRGTAVNGKPISGRTALRPGDQIHVGPVLLAFGVGAAKMATTVSAAGPTGAVFYKGEAAENIALDGDLAFGRGDDVDVRLDDPLVSRRHAMVKTGPDGCRLFDLKSKTGSFVNGRRFDEHDLVIGDQIQLGPFSFVYDGRSLHRVRRFSVGRIVAVGLTKEADTGPILMRANFLAEPGQLIGILGPSGAGKTTLLNALSGLRPADSGRILIDDADFYTDLDRLRSLFGYVPQDDIVHTDLTAAQALTFAARLRLAAGTPRSEIAKLVNRTISNLGLADRVNLKIHRLSGGQRKRVSVGVELLSRPPILFLDEPTSGLDPLAEFKVMELLRGLADNGCTVVCTTHVMENVYLMDQIVILSKGYVAFQGSPDEAQTKFGVSRLASLYGALQNHEPQPIASSEPLLPAECETRKPPADLARPKKAFSLPILLERQLAIFRSDPKNLAMMLAQPIVIGILVACATSDAPLTQFYIYVATLWFGSSNSAQEIVRELPIYRRERLVGLSRSDYLASKFVWLGGMTVIQSLLLYACIAIIRLGIHGTAQWQLIGLILLAFAATGIGLTISAFATSPVQAAMLVPLFLIPQIVFSGFSPPAKDMSLPVLWLSQIMPSFASERISDTSLLLDQKITGNLITEYRTPYWNTNKWYHAQTGQDLLNGTIYAEKRPVFVAYLSLVLWTLFSFAASFWLLARRERA